MHGEGAHNPGQRSTTGAAVLRDAPPALMLADTHVAPTVLRVSSQLLPQRVLIMHVQGPALPAPPSQWHFTVVVTRVATRAPCPRPPPARRLPWPPVLPGRPTPSDSPATATVMTATDAWRWDMPTDVHGQGEPWHGWVGCPPTNQPTLGPRLGRWWRQTPHRGQPQSSDLVHVHGPGH